MKLLHALLKFVVPLLLASPTFSAPYVCCGGGPGVGWCIKVASTAERRSVVLPLAEDFVCCCTAPSTKLCGELCVSILSFQPLHNLRKFLLVMRGLLRGVLTGRNLGIYTNVSQSLSSSKFRIEQIV